jgi:hypothetical protein
MLHPNGLTHQLGGTLDAVIAHADVKRPEYVSVIDVGLSAPSRILVRSIHSTFNDLGPCCHLHCCANLTLGLLKYAN